jgi:hypothetical integral membrane protein (TIGR02206 family)
MELLDFLFSPSSPARPFPFFQTPHLAALGGVMLLNGIIVWWGRRRPESRPVLRGLLAGVLLVNIAAFHLWHIVYGLWTVEYMLPFHLCGMMQWASLFLFVTRQPRLYEFVYFLGLGGATQALITPDSGGLGFPHFRAFETILSHGSIVTAALYFTFVEGYRPTLASVKRVLIWTQLYAVGVFFVNFLLGSNYMFLARKPDVPTLMDYLGPWPLYILALELIAFATVFLLYFPWAIKDHQRAAAAPAG